MPGIPTHFVALDQVIARFTASADPQLNAIAQAMNQEPAYANLGAVGPAIGDFLPADPPALPGSPSGTQYLRIWGSIFGVVGGDGTDSNPGLFAILKTMNGFLDQVTPIANDEDIEALKGFQGQIDVINQTASQLGSLVTSIPQVAVGVASSIGTGLRPAVDAPPGAPVPPPEVWAVRDFLHWKKPGAFAKALLKRARESGDVQWFYKEQAIVTAGRTLRSVLGTGGNELWLRNATLVPIPPSKVAGDPLYDDRIFRVLCECGIGLKLDIRQLVHQRQAMLAAHESERRPRPREIADNYYIDEALAQPEPSAIGVFDDLLTTGCHFKAMKAVLNDRFPGVAVTGIFLARRVAETDDPNAET
jgi:predicted amidophosphoribosyltransferase